jgi:hypothetical protein
MEKRLGILGTQGIMSEEQKTKDQKSELIIRFESPGSAEFSISANNIVPAQMLAVASYLEWKAKQMLQFAEIQSMQKEQEIRERNKLVVPGR